MTKVMRKEAQHTQRQDRASGVPPDILEHLPSKKNQSLPTLLLCALTSDFTGGCPPPPSHSLCQRVNINHLRYADDTILMAESEEELNSFLMRVKEEGERAGLKLNIKKLRSWHPALLQGK